MMVGHAGARAVVLLVSLLVGVALAGCIGGDEVDAGDEGADGGAAQANEPIRLDPIAADEATLVGTVVSDDFIPLQGAEVVVQATEFQTLTDGSGRYVLEHLPVGEVTVFAQADGFGVTAQNVVLEGGQVNALNFVLPTLASATPHVVVVERSGFIECAYGGAVVTANCIPLQFLFDELGTNPTNTVTIIKWDFEAPGLQAIVLELVWDAPADGVLARELQLLAETDSADITEGQTYGSATGSSPVRVELLDEDIPASADNVTGRFQTRVFPPFEPGNVVFQQKYTIFASFFYHKLPTAGYTGIPDGF